jgi:hypothetical protein
LLHHILACAEGKVQQMILHMTEVVAILCVFRLQAAAAHYAAYTGLHNAPYGHMQDHGLAAVGGIQADLRQKVHSGSC